MAGMTVKVDDAEFRRRIKNLKSGVDDPSRLMKVWGEIAHESIAHNFEVGGRPARWVPLSRVTVKLKGHARPLIGKTGQLKNIAVKPGAKNVEIGTSPAARAYAAIQQFGGNAGRGRKVIIPERPFVLLQQDDKTEMRAEMVKFFQRLGS